MIGIPIWLALWIGARGRSSLRLLSLLLVGMSLAVGIVALVKGLSDPWELFPTDEQREVIREAERQTTRIFMIALAMGWSAVLFAAFGSIWAWHDRRRSRSLDEPP